MATCTDYNTVSAGLSELGATSSPGVWRTDASMNKTRKTSITGARLQSTFPNSGSPQNGQRLAQLPSDYQENTHITLEKRASLGKKAFLASSWSTKKPSTSMPGLSCATASKKRFQALCSTFTSEGLCRPHCQKTT